MDLRVTDDNTPLGAFADQLGMSFEQLDGDGVVARWEAAPHLHQPYGIVHGGVHCTVVETLGSIVGAMCWGDRGQVVGVSNATDFYRAVSTGSFTSRATPLHRGRSQQVWLIETRDEDERLVSRGQVRLQNLSSSPG